MAYADYEFYQNRYCGNMPAADFRRLAVKASAYLDQLTFGRIREGWETSPHADRIRTACCAAADVYRLQEQGGGVASETNDGISVTYVNGVGHGKSESGQLYDAIVMHLGRTGLMYAGV